MNIAPATAELLRAYYGGREVPTTYALAVFDDEGALIAIAGLIPHGGAAFLYSDASRHLHKLHPKLTMRVTRRLLQLAETRGWDVEAQAEEDNDAAPRFLEHFGFELIEDRKYIKWAR